MFAILCCIMYTQNKTQNIVNQVKETKFSFISKISFSTLGSYLLALSFFQQFEVLVYILKDSS